MGDYRLGAVWAVVRAEARGRLRLWVALSLLIGVLAGVVLAAAAGARRSQTAVDRLLTTSHAPDALVSPISSRGDPGRFYAEVAARPEVAELGQLAGVPLALLDVEGQGAPRLAVPAASVDGQGFYRLYRPKVLAGRMPRPWLEDEVLITPEAAERLRLRVGSRLMAAGLSPEESGKGAWDPTADHPRYAFRVSGVGLMAEDLAGGPDTALDTALLTPAWFRAHADPASLSWSGALLSLRPGADVGRLRQALDAIAGRHPETGSGVFFTAFPDRYAAIRRAIRPQAVALAVFATLAGATSLVVVGQALSRHFASRASDHPTMRALGMTRAELVTSAVMPSAAVALVGAGLGVIAAVLASPWTLIGTARLAEPRPGRAVNAGLLALGALTVLALTSAWVFVLAWRAASVRRGVGEIDDGERARHSRVAAAAARGLPPPGAVGVGMALGAGGGRNAVPVRSALIGGLAAIGALTAAVVVAVNLARLVSTPHLYGVDWDYAIDAGLQFIPAERARAVLESVPGVGSYSAGNYGTAVVGGRAVSAIGIDQLRGVVFPTLLEGRSPRRPDEIVLGTNTLRRIHREVGQEVQVEVNDSARRMRIVGRAVFPALGPRGFPNAGLGDGAALTAEALAPPREAPDDYNFFLVRFGPEAHAERVSSRLAAAAAEAGCPPGETCGRLPDTLRPVDIRGYAEVRSTPIALSGLMAALAACTVGHALVTSVRGRRRDLAVLKTLGFLRRQVSAAVAWQACTVAGASLLFGLPLGVIAGRWAWALFGRQLGIGPEIVTPLGAVALVAPAALAVAVVVAALPGRAAGRTRPAAVLRAE